MTEETDSALGKHLDKGPGQEDLTFAYWRPSTGFSRFSALVYSLLLPLEGDRELQGNVAFNTQYARRALDSCKNGEGIALIHSHLGPGWQAMSQDDEIAERVRLASAVSQTTNLPLLGLTRGTDGTWSSRFWLRVGKKKYKRFSCRTVRVIGRKLRISFDTELANVPAFGENLIETVSVWGRENQATVSRTHVGIVGLGSVGA
jgi:hypothetical protein